MTKAAFPTFKNSLRKHRNLNEIVSFYVRLLGMRTILLLQVILGFHSEDHH